MTSTFTPEAALALGGPAWLVDRRGEAARRVAELPWPDPSEEAWRYSPIDELDLDAFAPAVEPAPADAAPDVVAIDDPAAVVVLVDGHLQHVELDDGLAAKGVRIGRASELDAGPLVGSVLGPAPDAVAGLNDAFGPDPAVIDVPAGVVVDRPVVVATHAATAGQASFPRLIVRAGDDSEVAIVDHRTSVDGDVLIVPIVEVAVGQAARVGYLEVQELATETWQVGTQASDVGQSARFVAAIAAFGAHYGRLRTECRLSGRGASGELLAAYFADGDQTLDFRTFQHHDAPDTNSNLLYLGAGAGSSRAVYTGTIRVANEARGTDAVQTNRTVKLSEHAWAESVPNLEILNNEVRCAHASAVGPVDEDQRFYLESRGVPPRIAERLIVAGFFDDVLTRLPVPALTPLLRADINEKLDRRES